VGAVLFPDGEPDLPDAMQMGGERIDVGYVVSVLMSHRDFARRLGSEAGLTAAT
jgi:hypothetical protein